MHDDIPATRVDSIIDSEIPGAYKISNDGMTFRCPCGCGTVAGVSFPRWTWDGNVDAPTIIPSIRILNGCKYHGHIHNGVWLFEGDSGL